MKAWMMVLLGGYWGDHEGIRYHGAWHSLYGGGAYVLPRYDAPFFFRNCSKKLITTFFHYLLDCLVRQLHVELLIVNPTVTDYRLGVSIIFQSLQVIEKVQQFICCLNFLIFR